MPSGPNTTSPPLWFAYGWSTNSNRAGVRARRRCRRSSCTRRRGCRRSGRCSRRRASCRRARTRAPSSPCSLPWTTLSRRSSTVISRRVPLTMTRTRPACSATYMRVVAVPGRARDRDRAVEAGRDLGRARACALARSGWRQSSARRSSCPTARGRGCRGGRRARSTSSARSMRCRRRPSCCGNATSAIDGTRATEVRRHRASVRRPGSVRCRGMRPYAASRHEVPRVRARRLCRRAARRARRPHTARGGAHAAPRRARGARRGRPRRGDPRRAAARQRRRQHGDPRFRSRPLPHRSRADRGRGDGRRARARRGRVPLQPRDRLRRRRRR